ncbi:MAG: hydroxymethylglutaryl-CoA synthase [bacterium]|nr:hydroxymethylglutaryl-CoA synthase [bacterium]
MVKRWTEDVGVVAWGSYIPKIFRGDIDEDTNSFCLNVVAEMKKGWPGLDLKKVGAVYVGSESFPYAVKPVVSIVSQQLGNEEIAGANLEFACKAGTAAMRAAILEVASGACKYALAMGADISQARPNDVLAKTVGAGAGGVIMGTNKQEILARVLWMGAVASDTPDFWRRSGQVFPEHTDRFTGAPSYLRTVNAMVEKLLTASRLKPEEFDFVILHSPNIKFPDLVAKKFRFRDQALVHRELFPQVKNAYAGSAPLGLCWALTKAKTGDRILVVSYGSGAGSDGFIFEVSK